MNFRNAAFWAVLAASPAAGQSDSVSKTLLTRQDAEVGAAALVTAIAISYFDPKIARFFSDTSLSHVRTGRRLDNIFTHVNETTLTAAGVAAYGIGRLAKSQTLTDIAFHTTEAVVTASLASQVIRGPLGRSRPHVTADTDQYDFHWFQGFTNFKYRAFPSIHTASAFGVATVYTLEAQRRSHKAAWIVGPIAYGLAAAPGLSRLYQGQHWASDILSGAFMGTLAGAKIVRYNHVVKPHNKVNRFFLGDRNIQTAFSGSGFTLSFAF